MNCKQFETALQTTAENRDELRLEIRDHAASCSSPTCREALADFDLLSMAIRAWTPGIGQANLTDGVLAEFGAATVGSRKPASREPASAPLSTWQCVAAALVLLAAGMALNGPRRAPTPASSGIANATASSAAIGGRKLSAPEISRQYVAWAEGAGSLVADAVGVVIPVGSAVGSDSMSQRPWIGEWFQRLEPAQREIDQALMFLESVSMAPAT